METELERLTPSQPSPPFGNWVAVTKIWKAAAAIRVTRAK